MAANDKNIIETIEAKNSLESKIYDHREKLDSDWVGYTKETDKLHEVLNNKENWLYDEGHNAKKSAYLKNLKEIDGLFKGIIEREIQFNGIPPRLEYLNS